MLKKYYLLSPTYTPFVDLVIRETLTIIYWFTVISGNKVIIELNYFLIFLILVNMYNYACKRGANVHRERLPFMLLLIDCLVLIMTCNRVRNTYTRAVTCAYFARNYQDIMLLILKWLL